MRMNEGEVVPFQWTRLALSVDGAAKNGHRDMMWSQKQRKCCWEYKQATSGMFHLNPFHEINIWRRKTREGSR
jgi:hypothetical protein